MFAEIEKPALLPLPAERFAFFLEAQRSVHLDGHIEVKQAYYSVPPAYVGRQVWARWDGRRSERYGATPVANTPHSEKKLEYQAHNGYETGKLTGCI